MSTLAPPHRATVPADPAAAPRRSPRPVAGPGWGGSGDGRARSCLLALWQLGSYFAA